MARVSFSARYGGYTCHFISKVPSELICALCTEALRDARLTTCCGQHYCLSCLKEWHSRTTNPTCPHCRKQDFSHFADLSVDRKVKQLRIGCKYQRKGCAWRGELGELNQHFKKCRYNSTQCPRGCGESVQPQDLSVHFMKRCVLREVQCEHCGTKVTHHDITTTKHYNVCRDFPLKCPNACSSRLFKRSLLSKHLIHGCPLQQIDCQYQVAGCTARILSVDQKQHDATHVQSHTDLLLGAFQNSTKALIHEAGLLSIDAGNASKKVPLECLKTIAGVYDSQLKEGGPPLTLRMNNFSSFKQKDKIWRSFTFSIGSYKMFVAVAANGIEVGRGSHVSVLLQAHHHDQHLCWHEEKLTIEILPQNSEALVDTSLCVVKGSNIPWDTFKEGGLPVTLFACPKFVAHTDLQFGMLMQDSLVFRLSVCTPTPKRK